MEIAEKTIFEIAQQKSNQDVQVISNLLMETVEQLEFRFNNKGSYTGVPSGYYDLDAMLAGFQRSDMIILAARPSMGKTAFALNIATNAAFSTEKAVAIFNLEMPAEQLVNRMRSAVGQIDSGKIRTGNMSHEDWKRINEANSQLSETNIQIVEN